MTTREKLDNLTARMGLTVTEQDLTALGVWDHPAAVFAILANDRGDAFTDSEADYALDMLDWPRR